MTPASVVVVGCGSIGLPFAVALARAGCLVEGYDTDTVRMSRLASGAGAPSETGLAEALAVALADGSLSLTSRLESRPACRTFVLAVPTPWSAGTGFDNTYLRSAVKTVAEIMNDGDALFVRSTTPVGTTRAIAFELGVLGLRVDVASIPDRSLEGAALDEVSRIPHLAGGVTPQATARAVALLERLGKVVAVDSADSAEAAKLFSNAARHVHFSLANEMALICEELDLDVHHVLEAARAGYERFKPARPGPIGGPCLNKDIGMLADLVPVSRAPIFNAARAVNGEVVARAVEAIVVHLSARPRGPARAALLGVAFKGRPAVADARGSAALAIAAQLRSADPSVAISAWDPEISAGAISELGLAAAASAREACTDADVVVFANDHPGLLALDRKAIGLACRAPALVYNLTGARFPGDPGFGPGVTVRTLGVHAAYGPGETRARGAS